MRSVDWITFMIYVCPTLIFEQLVAEYGPDAEQIHALMSLVMACSLSLLWEISGSDVGKIRS